MIKHVTSWDMHLRLFLAAHTLYWFIVGQSRPEQYSHPTQKQPIKRWRTNAGQWNLTTLHTDLVTDVHCNHSTCAQFQHSVQMCRTPIARKPSMTASLNKDLKKQLYHDLTQGREEIEDVTKDPNRQPQQDMVDFLKEAEDAIRSFYATQAGACLFTTQINYIQRGYGICCKRNKPMLALDQQRNLLQELNIQYISFHKKGWLKTLNMQQQNRLN